MVQLQPSFYESAAAIIPVLYLAVAVRGTRSLLPDKPEDWGRSPIPSRRPSRRFVVFYTYLNMLLTVLATFIIAAGEVAALDALATGRPKQGNDEAVIAALLAGGLFAVFPIFLAQFRMLRGLGGKLALVDGLLVLLLPIVAVVVGVLWFM